MPPHIITFDRKLNAGVIEAATNFSICRKSRKTGCAS
jgi:hypothetical protein